MAAKRVRTKVADLDVLVPSLIQAVRERGAISTAELTKLGVPKAQHEAAAARLRAEGFETNSKGVRLPVREQLRRRLTERSQLPLKGLEKLIRGCTTKEVGSIVDEFVQNRTAIRILRTSAEWIVAADTDVLSSDEIKCLLELLGNWAARVKKFKAKRKAVTLWRNDVRGLIDELLPLRHRARSGAPSEQSHDLQELLRLIRDDLDPLVGLTFVPSVVEKSQMPIEKAQTLLLDLAYGGDIELRPDSGAARFSEAEMRAAPAGPDGSRLFWVRPLGRAR